MAEDPFLELFLAAELETPDETHLTILAQAAVAAAVNVSTTLQINQFYNVIFIMCLNEALTWKQNAQPQHHDMSKFSIKGIIEPYFTANW